MSENENDGIDQFITRTQAKLEVEQKAMAAVEAAKQLATQKRTEAEKIWREQFRPLLDAAIQAANTRLTKIKTQLFIQSGRVPEQSAVAGALVTFVGGPKLVFYITDTLHIGATFPENQMTKSVIIESTKADAEWIDACINAYFSNIHVR